jgi:hypothetical protein
MIAHEFEGFVREVDPDAKDPLSAYFLAESLTRTSLVRELLWFTTVLEEDATQLPSCSEPVKSS